MSNVSISCEGITKIFDQPIVPNKLLQDQLIKAKLHREHQRIVALRDISLQVKRGEWIGLYGPNGSGKTTLLRIIAGLMSAEEGTVHIEGSIACFFELGVGFHIERNAAENIRLHCLLHGMSNAEIDDVTEDIIEFAGFASHRNLPLKCYSTGMLMRLAFAAATKVEADIYLIDEVLAVGDAAFRKRCREYFKKLKAEGKTAIIAAHSLEDLAMLCDNIYEINNGSTTPMRKTLATTLVHP